MTRNIVGGTSNIPKRYPIIINAHANKKISVKVLVIDNHIRNAPLQKHLPYHSVGSKKHNKINDLFYSDGMICNDRHFELTSEQTVVNNWYILVFGGGYVQLFKEEEGSCISGAPLPIGNL